MEQSKMLFLSNRIYSLLLRAYPAPFRREYGRDMAQLFRDDVRDTLRDSGTIALIGLWFLILIDLVKTAFAEHIWEVFHMPIEKMTRWSGPAAAIGGIFFYLGVIWNFGFDGANFSIPFVILTFMITIPLIGLGFYGLYKRLSTKNGLSNRLFFALALIGLIIYNTGSMLTVFLDMEVLLTPGLIGWSMMQLGLGGMGFIALSTNSLGKWSFTPLLVVGFSLLLMIVFFLNEMVINSPMIIGLILLSLSWILLGIGIMQNQEDQAGPAQFA